MLNSIFDQTRETTCQCRVLDVCPGDGCRYQFLVVDLSDLDAELRSQMCVCQEGRLIQVTLINWPNRPTLIYTGDYTAPMYVAEKLPSLSDRVVKVFASVCNQVRGDIDAHRAA